MTNLPPYPPPPPYRRPAPKKSMSQGHIAIITLSIVVPVMLLFGLAAAIGSHTTPTGAAAAATQSTAGPTTTSVPTSPTAAPTTAKPSPTGPAASFGDGTYLAGRDIQPGTYRTAGPADSYPSCYWARESNASGELDAIIANADPTGPAEVTVNSGEYFDTSYCQTWTRVG